MLPAKTSGCKWDRLALRVTERHLLWVQPSQVTQRSPASALLHFTSSSYHSPLFLSSFTLLPSSSTRHILIGSDPSTSSQAPSNQPFVPTPPNPTMSAEVIGQQHEALSKIDSAIDDAPASPSESKPRHRRTSSTVSGVFNILDLGTPLLPPTSVHLPTDLSTEKEGVELKIAPETQKLNWRVPSAVIVGEHPANSPSTGSSTPHPRPSTTRSYSRSS